MESKNLKPSQCYKVTSPKGKVSYLLGTIHLPFTKLPLELISLFGKTIRQVAVEIIIEKNDAKSLLNLFSRLPKNFLDRQIALEAKRYGLEVIELENLETLCSLLWGASAAFTKFEKLARRFYDPFSINQFFQAEGALVTQNYLFLCASYKDKCSDFLALNYEESVDTRNDKWQKSVFELLRGGDALICIGYSHLTGKNGYLARLLKAGYQLEPFPITFQIMPRPELQQEIQIDIANLINGSTVYLAELNLKDILSAFHAGQLQTPGKIRLSLILTIAHQAILKNDTIFTEDVMRLSQFSILNFLPQLEAEMLKIYKDLDGLKKFIVTCFAKQDPLDYENLTLQRSFALWISVFYPKVALELLETFKKSSNSAAVELFSAHNGPMDDLAKDIKKEWKEFAPHTQDLSSIPALPVSSFTKTRILSLLALSRNCYFMEDLDQEIFKIFKKPLSEKELDHLGAYYSHLKSATTQDLYENSNLASRATWQLILVIKMIFLYHAQLHNSPNALKALVIGFYGPLVEYARSQEELDRGLKVSKLLGKIYHLTDEVEFPSQVLSEAFNPLFKQINAVKDFNKKIALWKIVSKIGSLYQYIFGHNIRQETSSSHSRALSILELAFLIRQVDGLLKQVEGIVHQRNASCWDTLSNASLEAVGLIPKGLNYLRSGLAEGRHLFFEAKTKTKTTTEPAESLSPSHSYNEF